MPRAGVTIYDILLSCPGDVANLKTIVSECIEDFNRLYGGINNIKLELKHWSTDAYPQSGGSAQDLLNEQFIHDCDACIALLGNRFGSPTDRYNSGTEEEIEDMISSEKQVFMYFIEKAIDPSTIDLEQYTKVRNFKEKYSSDSKGIYWTIKDDNEFKKRLTNHLGLYFLPLIVKPQSHIEGRHMSQLEVDIDNNVNGIHKNLSNCNFLYNIEENIKKKIEVINNIHIPYIKVKTEEECENIKNNLNLPQIPQLNQFSKLLSVDYEKVQITDNVINCITEYCNNKNIIIKEEFWGLGNLKKENKKVNFVSPLYSTSNSIILEGTEDEKKKYELIEELDLDIYKYNNYKEYFSNIDSYIYYSLYIKNIGTSFDEDIDISIKLPKKRLIKGNEIPIPKIGCIEEINEHNLVEAIFSASSNANVEKYSYYPIHKLNSSPLPVLAFNKSARALYEEEKEKYINDIERIFCYRYYEEEKNDIIKFNLKYLKQNNSMYFPSILLFSEKPEYIEYEIISKHYPDVISGKCKC